LVALSIRDKKENMQKRIEARTKNSFIQIHDQTTNKRVKTRMRTS
jgi:hypothetical protein